jgi:hypothetical protein
MESRLLVSLYIGLLSLAIILPAFAQDDWPPDLDEIFTDAVEVIDVEQTEPTPYVDTRPTADNEARIVRVYDDAAETWQEFPYPDAFASVDDAQRQASVIALQVVEDRAYSPDEPQWTPWTLNPITGEFALYVTPCIDWSHPNTLELNVTDRWVFFYDSRLTNRAGLCRTGTGELRGLLPVGAAPQDQYGWVIEESPTGRWLVIFNIYGDETPIYVYDLETDRTEVVEGAFNVDTITLGRWLTDTGVLLYTGGMPESWPRYYFSFDVTQPENLYQVSARGHWFGERYEYLETTGFLAHTFGSYSPVPCTYTVLYPDTVEPVTYTLGDDCGNVVRYDDDNLMYLSHTLPENGQYIPLRLFRLHIPTGEQTLLAERYHFEWLLSASADGRYAVIVTDESGVFQMFEVGSTDQPFFDWGRLENLRLVIYDTETDREVYQSLGFSGGSAEWLNDTTVNLELSDVSQSIPVDDEGFVVFEWLIGGTHLIQLAENSISDIRLSENVEAIVAYSTDRRFLITQRNRAFTLLDVQNDVATTIIDQENRTGSFEFSWDENNLLLVRYEDWDGNVATFTVRIVPPE